MDTQKMMNIQVSIKKKLTAMKKTLSTRTSKNKRIVIVAMIVVPQAAIAMTVVMRVIMILKHMKVVLSQGL